MHHSTRFNRQCLLHRSAILTSHGYIVRSLVALIVLQLRVANIIYPVLFALHAPTDAPNSARRYTLAFSVTDNFLFTDPRVLWLKTLAAHSSSLKQAESVCSFCCFVPSHYYDGVASRSSSNLYELAQILEKYLRSILSLPILLNIVVPLILKTLNSPFDILALNQT